MKEDRKGYRIFRRYGEVPDHHEYRLPLTGNWQPLGYALDDAKNRCLNRIHATILLAFSVEVCGDAKYKHWDHVPICGPAEELELSDRRKLIYSG